MEHQILWAIAALIISTALAVRLVLAAIGSAYGNVIATLSAQNVSQQRQISELKAEQDRDRADCRLKLDFMQGEIEKLRKQLNGFVKG